jgi:hypothetical protein
MNAERPDYKNPCHLQDLVSGLMSVQNYFPVPRSTNLINPIPRLAGQESLEVRNKFIN